MAKAKKKFIRKKSTEKLQPEDLGIMLEDTVVEDVEYELLIHEAKKLDVQFSIAGSKEDELIEVNDWITCPDAIADMIGAPGIPCGLITMVYGPPDCGKTTMCNDILANTQRDGGYGFLFLSELKYDNKRASFQGVKVDGGAGSLIKYRPRTIEQVGDLVADVAKLIEKSKTKKKVCIVWDSLGATPCENELNEKRADFSMDAAKAITGVLRKAQAMIKDKKIAFVMINQIYDKTGVTFGKKTTTRGGKSPVYYSALCLEFAKLGRVRPPGKKSPAPFCGIKVQIEAAKNHLGPPFQKCEMEVDWKGFVVDRKPEYAPKDYFNASSKLLKEEE